MINFSRLSSIKIIPKNVCNSKGIHSTSKFFQNTANTNRQVKVFQKLLGNKKSGNKKRWFINEFDQSSGIIANPIKVSQTKYEGKNANRRIAVLNKLFMKYITDLMATGSTSDEIVGKGIEISRVKVTPDFHGVNVFWICKGTTNDMEIEKILNRNSGIIRHELSQLRLMGEVPKIRFVKDKSYAKLIEVENILKTCDFGDNDYVKYDLSIQTRNELNLEYSEYEKKTTNHNNDVEEERTMNSCSNNDDEDDEPLPIMRHDVLGLNHKEIMDKILGKMKKSKMAWNTYEEDVQTPIQSSGKEMEKIQQKLEDNKLKAGEFEKFLMRKKNKKNTPSRKKYDKYEESVWDNQVELDDKNLEDEGDYIEENENGKL